MPYDLPDWIEMKIIPEPNSGCWLWTASTDEHGYGWIKLGRLGKKQFRYPAHRLIFEFYNGPVDDALVMDHLCRLSCCVNPEHQEPVTQRVNILRGTGVSARNAKKIVCKNGHSLHDAYVVGGNRKCRACQLSNMKRYYRHAARRDKEG